MKLPIYIVDGTGAGVEGIDISAEAEVSRDGGAFGPALGLWAEVGDGAYWYSPSPVELAAKLLVLRVDDAVPYLFSQTLPLVYDIKAGATGAATYIPFYLVNPTTGVAVTGASPNMMLDEAQLRVSYGGALWSNGNGSWHEIGEGTYYYAPDPGEVATGDLLMVKVAIPGTVTTLYAVQISPAVPAIPPTVPVFSPAVEPDDPAYVDHVALALGRMCQQFRGNEDEE